MHKRSQKLFSDKSTNIKTMLLAGASLVCLSIGLANPVQAQDAVSPQLNLSMANVNIPQGATIFLACSQSANGQLVCSQNGANINAANSPVANIAPSSQTPTLIGGGNQPLADTAVSCVYDPAIAGNLKCGVGASYGTAINTTAIGNTAVANATSATALGYIAEATNANATALGTNSKATGNQSTATGAGSQARGQNATASGYDAWAGRNTAETTFYESASAFGASSRATNDFATAIGRSANATAANSTALGAFSFATALSATATGSSAQAYGANSVATGFVAVANANNSIAMGYRSLTGVNGLPTSGINTIAIGGDSADGDANGANASAASAIAIGTDSTASGIASTVVGDSANAIGDYSAAFGRESKARSHRSISIGFNASAGFDGFTGFPNEVTGSIAIGESSMTLRRGNIFNSPYVVPEDKRGSIAIGRGAENYSENSIAIGPKARVRGFTEAINPIDANYAVGIGAEAFVSNDYATAIGALSKSNRNGVAIGYNATAGTDAFGSSPSYYFNNVAIGAETSAFNWSSALGYKSNARGNGSLALGGQATTEKSDGQTNGNIAIGTSSAIVNSQAEGGTKTTANGGNAIAMGTAAQATGLRSIAIGGEGEDTETDTGAQASGESSTALGNDANATSRYATAIGANSSATGFGSFGLGAFSSASASYSTAVGVASFALSDYGVALGYNAVVQGLGNNIAIGRNAFSNGNGSIAIGYLSNDTGLANVFSVGNASLLRKIIHVANGNVAAGSTDAVNGRQLFALCGMVSGCTAGALNAAAGGDVTLTVSSPMVTATIAQPNNVAIPAANVTAAVVTLSAPIATAAVNPVTNTQITNVTPVTAGTNTNQPINTADINGGGTNHVTKLDGGGSGIVPAQLADNLNPNAGMPDQIALVATEGVATLEAANTDGKTEETVVATKAARVPNNDVAQIKEDAPSNAPLTTANATQSAPAARPVAVNATPQDTASDISALQALTATQGASIASLQGKYNTLNDLVSRNQTEARAGIAAMAALGRAPMPSEPGKTSYTVDFGMFHEETGFGASLAHRFDTKNPFAITAGVSSSGKETVARVGIAGEF